MSTSGAVELPGGRTLPDGPWIPYGHDFVQGSREDGVGYLLRGDSGWIGVLDNAGGVLADAE
ncbi:hypothetical protein NGM37_24260, partial [Streptomyces sp. TRM76130]|nr:hypothetical protein [Streptomyces sp. TRM76130]